ncbi:MAG: TrmH family RNA methyltransferase [Clostridia bacterium]|nr:TrmH family RNA methyltransferase [Clostridia bacterium]
MKFIKIGKENATFQHFETIKNNRNKRFSNKEIFVEGVRNINIAIENGWKVKNFIFTNYDNLSNWAKEKILSEKTENNYELSKELMSKISRKDDASELVAIFKIKENILPESKCPLIIIFDRPSRKGNLGTMIRSADALGVDAIIITGHAIDIYDPEVISTSMGSYFNIPLFKFDDNKQLLDFISLFKSKYNGLKIVATDEKAEFSIKEIDFTKPTILLMGNEGVGLSKFYLDICDVGAKIEMVGKASSLNVSCAASIILYEIFNQRKIK